MVCALREALCQCVDVLFPSLPRPSLVSTPTRRLKQRQRHLSYICSTCIKGLMKTAAYTTITFFKKQLFHVNFKTGTEISKCAIQRTPVLYTSASDTTITACKHRTQAHLRTQVTNNTVVLHIELAQRSDGMLHNCI